MRKMRIRRAQSCRKQTKEKSSSSKRYSKLYSVMYEDVVMIPLCTYS